MDNAEICYYCEVCHNRHADRELIVVEGIDYLYICKGCAEKICTALKEKVGTKE